MSTSTPTTPKGTRSSRRNPKPVATPISFANTQTHTLQSLQSPATPPQACLHSQSPADAVTEDSLNLIEEGGVSKRKKGRSGRKNRDVSKSSPMPNGSINHRHTSSQPSIISPSTLRNSPHYAGPTFHASPAPSALPMPSFFSKSVPDADFGKSGDLEDESEDIEIDTTPSKPRPTQSEQENSSPLDFLFRAAREAKAVGHSKADLGSQSSTWPHLYADSKHHSQPQAFDGTTGELFPLELDGSDAQTMSIGPSFATSYKDRINALRSESSPSRSSDNMDLDEDGRKAKTEALKNLLLNPLPQRPVSASPRRRDHPIMFSSRPSTPHGTMHNILPARHSSGPSTPVPFDEPLNLSRGRYEDQKKSNIPHYLSSAYNSSHNHRSPSSNLRQEISVKPLLPAKGVPTQVSHPSHNSTAQVSFARPQGSLNDLSCPTPNRNISLAPTVSPTRAFSTSMKPVETKQMEDDLRRILKLDVNGSLEPRGVGSSFT